MADLGKLGIGLTVVFALSLVALLTEICYIFLFRRRRRTPDGESNISGESGSRSTSWYLFCCRSKSFENPGVPTTVHPVDEEDDTSIVEEQGDELVKWQERYGPSRILFTIKEEEREDLESELSSSELKSKRKGEREEEEMVIVMVGLERETETPYYTPSSSPVREAEMVEREECFVVQVGEMQNQREGFPVGTGTVTVSHREKNGCDGGS